MVVRLVVLGKVVVLVVLWVTVESITVVRLERVTTLSTTVCVLSVTVLLRVVEVTRLLNW